MQSRTVVGVQMYETLFGGNGLHHHPSSAERAVQTKSRELLAPQTTRSADKAGTASLGRDFKTQTLRPSCLLYSSFRITQEGNKSSEDLEAREDPAGWRRHRLHLLTGPG